MSTPYTPAFFRSQRDMSEASASVIAPITLSLFPSASVVDIGCGVGGWLKAFEACGIKDYLGFDGDYIPLGLLKIPADRFRAADLRTLSDVGRRFDLACSLEVAEHLPGSCAQQLVTMLVRAAPVVLFSAAIPNQGGTDHINLQWQSYWCKIFNTHGYIAVDCIRPAVFGNPMVEWWYRQNALVYCHADRFPPGYAGVTDPYQLDRVDPAMLAHVADKPHSGREALSTLTRSIFVLGRSVGKKLFSRSR